MNRSQFKTLNHSVICALLPGKNAGTAVFTVKRILHIAHRGKDNLSEFLEPFSLFYFDDCSETFSGRNKFCSVTIQKFDTERRQHTCTAIICTRTSERKYNMFCAVINRIFDQFADTNGRRKLRIEPILRKRKTAH